MRSRSRTRASRHVAAGGTSKLLLVFVALASAPAALAAPLLDVTPSSGVVGASLSATGAGFPEGPVTFRWDNGQLLGTVSAGPAGTASLDFLIPATATVGSHFVRACSTSKCPQGTVYADATVTVVPPPTPTPVPPTPTPAPTPVPTPVPTPPGQTPKPTLRPGQTPAPTLVPTLPNGSPAPVSPGASGSFEASPSVSAAPTDLGASSTALVIPGGEVTGPPPSGDPTSGSASDGGLPVVPIAIGALGVVLLLSVFLTLRRRRPSSAPVAASAGPNALPTSWDDPGSEPETQLAASIPVWPSAPPEPAPSREPEPAPWPAADQPPRQRTIVVHVTPKEPPKR